MRTLLVSTITPLPHADNSCVNNHAFVEHVVEGVTVDVIPFDDQLGKASNLTIVHAIYAVGDPITFRMHLLRINNAIYTNTEASIIMSKSSPSIWYNLRWYPT